MVPCVQENAIDAQVHDLDALLWHAKLGGATGQRGVVRRDKVGPGKGPLRDQPAEQAVRLHQQVGAPGADHVGMEAREGAVEPVLDSVVSVKDVRADVIEHAAEAREHVAPGVDEALEA